MKDYFTVNGVSTQEYTVNKSRFIGYVCPASSDKEAVNFINEIRDRRTDAAHNVYAYRIREPEYMRYSDAGEPQGTAGTPVLDVIRKNGLTDTCIVVTRYFGGILLGTGGLVRAYSHTAALAVNSAGIVKMSLCRIFNAKCEYSFYGRLAALVAEFEGKAETVDFAEKVSMVFRIPAESETVFLDALARASLGKVFAEKIGEKYDAL